MQPSKTRAAFLSFFLSLSLSLSLGVGLVLLQRGVRQVETDRWMDGWMDGYLAMGLDSPSHASLQCYRQWSFGMQLNAHSQMKEKNKVVVDSRTSHGVVDWLVYLRWYP